MTKPTTSTFGQFAIQVGNGADPEVFSAPCGLTSKGFNQTANTQDTVVPDCDDPDAPAFTETAVDSIAFDISGSGVLAKEAHNDIFQPWFASAANRNVRVYPFGPDGGYYAGAAILTQYQMSGQRGQKVNVAIAIKFDGGAAWTAGS